jgi:hypothetical protein
VQRFDSGGSSTRHVSLRYILRAWQLARAIEQWVQAGQQCFPGVFNNTDVLLNARGKLKAHMERDYLPFFLHLHCRAGLPAEAAKRGGQLGLPWDVIAIIVKQTY